MIFNTRGNRMENKQKINETVTLYLKEESLSRILAALTITGDDDKELKDYLQQAGENIFRW